MSARDNWGQVAHNLRILADSIDAAIEPPAASAGVLAAVLCAWIWSGLKPGQAVRFEFVERQPGDFVVTSIASAGAVPRVAPRAKPAAPAASAGQSTHSGH